MKPERIMNKEEVGRESVRGDGMGEDRRWDTERI